MNKIFRSIVFREFAFKIFVGIAFGFGWSFILLEVLPDSSKQELSSQGINQYSAGAIATVVFTLLTPRKLVHLITPVSNRSVIRQTIDSMSGLDIPEQDKRILANSVGQAWASFEQHDSVFLSAKLDELCNRFEDPIANKQMALEEFREAIRQR